ncbi:MAG: T9SS type A sorting domain-containing protein [Saprospiraceae bacterium]
MKQTIHTIFFALISTLSFGQNPTKVKAGIFHNGSGGYEIRLQGDADGLVNPPNGSVQTFQITIRFDHTQFSPSITNIASPTHGSVSVNTYVGPAENPNYTYIYMSMSPGTHVSIPEAPGELVSLTFTDASNVNATIELTADSDPFATTIPNSVGINPRFIYDAVITAPAPNNDGFYQSSSLPLELIAFRANEMEGHILLSWKSVLEINFSGYELQRSTDGVAFKKIAWVAGKGGTGENNYSYHDLLVDANTRYYYRLKMTDVDGSFSYSAVRSAIAFGGQKNISISPNPVYEKTFLSILSEEDQHLTVKLSQSQGEVILQSDWIINAGQNNLEVQMYSYPVGIYFIQIFKNKGELIWSEKIVKK